MDLFEAALAVRSEDIDLLLRPGWQVPWADYLLNPRRLRGSDFLMRWSQGVWSEERIVEAVNQTGAYVALPYGPSGVAPSEDIREFELYFERLERAGLGHMKRPDLLIFRKADAVRVQTAVEEVGGTTELPFVAEDDPRMRRVLSYALIAVECENSLWRARSMPDYGTDLRPMRRLGGKLGLRKGAVVPTIILKDEDRAPLGEWQSQRNVPVHIWHVFYDMAFGVTLDQAETLIEEGRIEATIQVFQAPGGATTRKAIYKVYYQHAYPLGVAQEEPTLVADHIMDRNGHILPYVRFQGGRLVLTEEALQVLAGESRRSRE
jgi:hypothetical protein